MALNDALKRRHHYGVKIRLTFPKLHPPVLKHARRASEKTRNKGGFNFSGHHGVNSSPALTALNIPNCHGYWLASGDSKFAMGPNPAQHLFSLKVTSVDCYSEAVARCLRNSLHPPSCGISKVLRGGLDSMKGTALTQVEIQALRNAGVGFPGERGQELIAMAALRRFGLLEITVFSTNGTHEYFRIGDKGKHGIQGVHVHEPYFQWNNALGFAPGNLRAGSSGVVGLTGDRRLKGPPGCYVDELLRALAEGRYDTGYVDG
jgi:hypothetical protein